MRKNLWNLFFNAFDSSLEIEWRIYGNHSHKLLCKDYRVSNSDYLDELKVIKYTKRKNYWRIVVED